MRIHRLVAVLVPAVLIALALGTFNGPPWP
jgi:hypothetical protein